MPRRTVASGTAPVVGIIVALAMVGCGGKSGTGSPTQPSAPMSSIAQVYLDEVIAAMEAHSLHRQKLNWESVRAGARAKAPGAQTISDTYSAIAEAIRLLGDNHSFFITNVGAIVRPQTSFACRSTGEYIPAASPGIGYVKVRAFSGGADEALIFADDIQSQIRSADRPDLVGWIIDLRGNGGGNMWPMIAGLGPVLGDEVLGYFVDPTGESRQWGHRGGASWLEETIMARASAPYRLSRQQPRVAVLTDGLVASSGEATVISFRQRPNTRSFGTPTCGVSTSNVGFTMSDGGLLVLTVAVMADRMRTPYGGPVEPDELITDPEQTVIRAVEWLRSGT